MTGSNGGWRYRAGMVVAAATAFLIVWTTIVRDDGNGGGFLVIMAAMVGAFATRAHSDGMARTMLGTAAMQAVFGLATVTAPITAQVPDGVLKAAVSNTAFAIFWLLAAVCFYAATKRSGRAEALSA